MYRDIWLTDTTSDRIGTEYQLPVIRSRNIIVRSAIAEDETKPIICSYYTVNSWEKTIHGWYSIIYPVILAEFIEGK
jgi:hypothetical protein